METKIEKVNIELTGREARDIAYHIRYSLCRSIDTHWTNLQGNEDGEKLFFENEKESINMMKELFIASADLWAFENSIDEFKKKFAEKREELKIIK